MQANRNQTDRERKKEKRKTDMSSRRGGRAEEGDCDTEKTTPMPAAAGLRQSKRTRRERPAAGLLRRDEVGGGVPASRLFMTRDILKRIFLTPYTLQRSRGILHFYHY
jgi:hypothetical protein